MRPTISLAMIVKNERKNLEQLLESVRGCMDEIHITDTGSTDGTVEFLKEHGQEIAGCPVHVHHFKWIEDFSAARNYSFSHVKTDFILWLDGDDVLLNREAFIKWRDCGMEFADMHLATYHYASDAEGKPVISFARERVFRRAKNPTWKYFIHEGVIPTPDWKVSYITTWAVKHMRDAEDQAQDKSRNIKILESRKAEFDGRMHFYYGKELFENQQFEKALSVLTEACTRQDIELHDRILGLQYAAYSAIYQAEKMKPEHQAEKLLCAIQLAQQGLLLDATRAELHCVIGDAYTKLGKLKEALPYYAAAEHCISHAQAGSAYAGAIYNYGACYGEIPKLNKSKIYFHLGQLDKAEEEAKKAADLGSEEAKKMLEELERIWPLVRIDGPKEKTQDVVITCPPQQAYPFDEAIYKTKPLGGSETALVEVAKWIKQLTGRPVKVFNGREETLVAESGVEYISNTQLNEYMAKHEPAVHIAWRHNIKLTNAPTYLWCHDLLTPTVEIQRNFDKIMCLSPFHRDYVQAMQGVPSEQIMLTRNGLSPEKFVGLVRKPKDPNKLVWMSSPDRGLEQCMLVLDEVRKTHPDIKLHVYYGLENLYKYGLGELADKLKTMMAERPWVVYHGFTEQKKMYSEVSDAVVWPHSCSFIETFCITALEMLSLGIFPITRKLGALKDTLADAESKGQAVLLPHGADTPEQIEAYAKEIRAALDERKWERVSLDPESISWRGVAEQWIGEMKL